MATPASHENVYKLIFSNKMIDGKEQTIDFSKTGPCYYLG